MCQMTQGRRHRYEWKLSDQFSVDSFAAGVKHHVNFYHFPRMVTDLYYLNFVFFFIKNYLLFLFRYIFSKECY